MLGWARNEGIDLTVLDVSSGLLLGVDLYRFAEAVAGSLPEIWEKRDEWWSNRRRDKGYQPANPTSLDYKKLKSPKGSSALINKASVMSETPLTGGREIECPGASGRTKP